MLDEVIVLEVPPLTGCYGRRGQQVCVPVSGHHSRRILHGVINVLNGTILLLITEEWNAETHQCFLQMIRARWRGWHIILFEDRGSPHTAEDSQELAKALGIQIRFLPRATPKLNAMDHLFRFVKGRALANRQTITIDNSADAASDYLLKMSSQERLLKAGILSGNFWLTN
jgi:hypothetical protein